MRVISTNGVSPISERIAGGFLPARSASVETSSMSDERQPLVRGINDDLVIAKVVVTDDAVEFRTNGFAESGKEISDHHRHLFRLGATHHKCVQHAGGDSN